MIDHIFFWLSNGICGWRVVGLALRKPGNQEEEQGLEPSARRVDGEIIGAAIEVHKALGPGFIEAAYENALAIELRAQNTPFQRQLSVPILPS